MTITPDIATYRDTCRASGGALSDVFGLGPMHLSAFLEPLQWARRKVGGDK